ncbi:hypothetical protein BDF20DRAFT_818025, partial [Mycotypha africana]|uniref:uncharacterized protein n=1 Tax=Mycotypha africana TaxID=64632 RepID=UPI0022FFCE1F
NVWRPPGHFEIPDILGHAFLKPEPHTPIELRPLDVSKHISTKPWYPPNPYYQIPSLASPSRASSKK